MRRQRWLKTTSAHGCKCKANITRQLKVFGYGFARVRVTTSVTLFWRARTFSTRTTLCTCACSSSYRRDAGLNRIYSRRDVFNWLWPPLLQERLDEYREYWNNHTVRRQKDKDLPSGTSPVHIWTCPTDVRPTARDCRVNVRRDMIQELRNGIGGEEGRRRAYQFVTPEFQAAADGAYADLGYPRITLATAWAVFQAIVDVLRADD